MSFLVDKKMNDNKTVSEWRDEDGCNKITIGKNKTNLQDIDSGLVMGNTTRGHYQADLLDSITGKWVRTSDDELPVEISEMDVTDQGYIFLYKNISQ